MATRNKTNTSVVQFKPSAPKSVAVALTPPRGTSAGMSLSSMPFVAGLVITLCGLFAAQATLGDYPGWGALYLAVVVGFVFSSLWQHRPAWFRLLEAAIVCAAAIACVSTMLGQMPDVMAQLGFLQTDDRFQTLAMCLVWLAVLRAFFADSPGALLFGCVPTLAIMGLVGTVTDDTFLVLDFMVFLAAAVFLIMHLTQLRHYHEAEPAGRFVRDTWRAARQWWVAVGCVAAAGLLGVFFAQPMESIGGAALASAGLYVAPHALHKDSPASSVQYKEPKEIRVATGPTSGGDQTVMQVRSPEEHYWRGATFDEYTGHGWRNSMDDTVTLWPTEEVGYSLPGTDEAVHASTWSAFMVRPTRLMGVGMHKHRLRQVVTFHGQGNMDLYAAGEPARLLIDTGRITMDAAANLSIVADRQVSAYVVESLVTDADPRALRRLPHSVPPAIAKYYLSLDLADPGALNRIRAKAQEVAQGQTNDYDRVAALAQYVAKTCRYNLKAAPAPTGTDVVDSFLFDQKEGYCDSFATALAVLCRSIGIPARVATGFLPGEHLASSGEYVVRDRDKHEWTEVFFDGYGWATFDATSGAVEVKASDAGAQRKGRSLVGRIFSHGWLPPLGVLICVSLLLYVFKTEWLDRRSGPQTSYSLKHLPAPNLEVVRLYGAACGAWARHGIRRGEAQTPAEFARECAASAVAEPDTAEAMHRLTELFVSARYGERPVEPALLQEARQCAAAVQKLAKRPKQRAQAAPAET